MLKGLSIQAEDNYVLNTAIVLRGEQITNQDAKVAGAIMQFVTRMENVSKWCLNGNVHVENTKTLKHFCDIGTDSEIYKPVRLSQIMMSEKLVSSVFKVLVEHYVNSFGLNVDIDHLVCLTSDVPVKEENATTYCLCPIEEKKSISISLRHV